MTKASRRRILATIESAHKKDTNGSDTRSDRAKQQGLSNSAAAGAKEISRGPECADNRPISW